VSVCASTVALIGREHLRLPAFSVPTFSMPVLVYLFFGTLRGGHGEPATSLELLGYCGFAVLGVALFSFGASLAMERVSPWEQFQRTLPVSALLRYVARVAVVLTFSVASLLPLLAVGLTVGHADPTIVLRPANLLPLGLGVAVFSALGTTAGYWLPVRGAVPLTNLLYLPLSFAGGLLGAARAHRLDRWSVLPTTQWNDLLYGTSVQHRLPVAATVGLLAWLLLLSGLAVLGYRRVERETFR
jgi:ABC-2 type transport system permease protein